MFFTRKKVQRDREAGLTFVWRGARSNTGGLILAFGMVAALTAVVGSVVRVTVVPPAEVVERHATVVVVTEGAEDGGLVALAEERTPLPSRFDPELELAQEQAGAGGPEVIRAVYAPELGELRDEEGEVDLPLAPAGELVLPVRRAAAQREGEAAGEGGAAASLSVRGELSGRLPATLPGWEGPAAPEWIGRPLSFVVGVDGGGRVRHCMPLDESLEALDVEAESWLRRVRMDPAAHGPRGALTWGAVEFRLKVVP